VVSEQVVRQGTYRLRSSPYRLALDLCSLVYSLVRRGDLTRVQKKGQSKELYSPSQLQSYCLAGPRTAVGDQEMDLLNSRRSTLYPMIGSVRLMNVMMLRSRI
jgi:hypothetical protein